MAALAAEHVRLNGNLVLRGAQVGNGLSQGQLEGSDSGYLKPVGDHVQSRRRVLDWDVRSPVRLTGARIDGDVVLAEIFIATDCTWAVYAPRIQVAGAFVGLGMRSAAGINLAEAHVENSVILTGARIGGVDASIATMQGGFFADWGFVSTGPVELLAIQVGNIVTFHDSELQGMPTAVNLTRSVVSRIRLDLREPPRGRVILRDVRVNSLIDEVKSWPAADSLDLEGLKYHRISGTEYIPARERIAWILKDSNVSASSFEQLAMHYQGAGDERSARAVRLARERHLLRRGTFASQVWGRLQDVLFGYGYVPARALLWLSVLVLFGTFWFLGHPVAPLKEGEHPTWDPFIYSLDLAIPIVDLGQEKAWDPTGSNKAVVMIMVTGGWLLASAVVAGARRLLARA